MRGARLLLLGASGQVGTAFMGLLDGVIPVNRDQLDLGTTTPDEIESLVRSTDPSVLINCAAFTAVDRAEGEQELATRINGQSVGWLSEITSRYGIPLLTYSTDYVFDGEAKSPYLESDPTNPINAYGRSKLEGEQAALIANPKALVIRTSWVLSATHRNFVTAILGRVVRGQPTKVVDDQVGCPTVADDLAVGSWEALRRGASGLLHLTNRGSTTWYQLARHAVIVAGLDVSVLMPCSTEEYDTIAPRPAYSVLGSEVVGPLDLSPLPEWYGSMERVVASCMTLIGR